MYKPVVTWQEYYNAIQNGDLSTIETALLVYDVQAITAPLDECDSAIKIAVKSKQAEVVKFLISNPLFSKLSGEEREEILNCAFQAACSSSESAIADLLMENEYFGFTLSENQLTWLMNNNNLQLIQRYLKKKYENNTIPVEIQSQIGFHAIINGYFNVRNLEIIGDINEYTIEMDPLFKAMFLQDEKTVRRIAASHSMWYRRNYDMGKLTAVSSDTSVLSFIFADTYSASVLQPFQYAGRLGDPHLVRIMREYVKDPNQLAAVMEDACDEACREGQTQLLHIIFKERWVNTEYGNLWKRRLKFAVEECHPETSCLIMDTYLLEKAVGIHGETPQHKVAFDAQFYDNIFNTALRNKDFVATERLIVWQPNNQKWSDDCFEAVVSRGKVDVAYKYISKGASFVVKITDEWCKYWALNVKSVVLLEILSATCPCGTDLLLKEIQHPFQTSFVELACDLLLRGQTKPNCSNGLVNVEWMAMIAKRNKMAAFITFLDRYDVILLSNALSYSLKGSLANSDSIYKWKEICDIFTTISGTRSETVEWCGLLDGIKNLDYVYQRAFRQLIYECGVTVTDTDTEDLSSNETNKHIKMPNLPIPVVSSLKSSCRLAVRRSIRLAHPEGSMRDMVMSLYTTGYLPRSLAPYMLYRDRSMQFSDIEVRVREKIIFLQKESHQIVR